MLWDIIHDFFVQHVFGGYTSSGNFYTGFIGNVYCYLDDQLIDSYEIDTGSLLVKTPFVADGYTSDTITYFNLGDYFSFIATIISMVVIVILCCALIKKIYNMCAHIIG